MYVTWNPNTIKHFVQMHSKNHSLNHTAVYSTESVHSISNKHNFYIARMHTAQLINGLSMY